MSSFDVRKHIRERRLKEATEQLRGKQQFSAPPSVFRQSQQQSARSSVIEFDDGANVHALSETDADWYQDKISSQEKNNLFFFRRDAWKEQFGKDQTRSDLYTESGLKLAEARSRL